ncbi:MAG: EAL domain-containing protein [Acidimicrobiales bacterium]
MVGQDPPDAADAADAVTVTVADAADAADPIAVAERYRLLAEATRDVVMLSRPGHTEWISPSVTDLLGYRPEDLYDAELSLLIHPDDRATTLAQRADVAQGRAVEGRVRLRHKDGTWHWFEGRGQPVPEPDGGYSGRVVSTWRLVDEEVATVDRLARREALLRVILDSSPDVIVRYGRDLRIDYANQRIAEVTGRPPDSFLGKANRDLPFDGYDAIRWDLHLTRVLESGDPDAFDFEGDLGSGERAYEVRLVPEADAAGQVSHVVVQCRDVTDRRQAEEQLELAATHDPLTGLANRALLLDEIDRSLKADERSARTTAVLMIDLDHFKYVNDSLGHQVGDDLLRRAARRLEDHVRGGDLVARHGGDEFVVVMRSLEDPAEAVRVAERLVAAFRRPLVVGDAELFATASIGIASNRPGRRDRRGADDLLREADTAMYVAKQEGRDRLSLFSDDLRVVASERLRLESELRPALGRGELVLWYQPEIDLLTGRLLAVESLLRWHHPSGRLYVAGEFIEVAEESGLILEIGRWVLAEACAQAARWDEVVPERPLTVRVNLSALQLSDGALLADVDAALTAAGLDPRRLCVEITETALLRDLAAVEQNLRGLRARGIGVAVDDFGTGYASLTYLRQFPVDVLKLDRSFVAGLTDGADERERRLVAGIIALAHRLEIPVTAEGVETDEQARRLRDLGCRSAQGFWCSAAVPPADIEAILLGAPTGCATSG